MARTTPDVLPDGKILDFIDEKIRSDTPEEYVRQQIARRLVLELGYKREQIAVEFPVKVGSSRTRVDLAVFDDGDAHEPENARILIECKKDSVPPTAKKDGLEQLRSYIAACTNVQYGMWTNGKQKVVIEPQRNVKGGLKEMGSYPDLKWPQPNDIPPASGDIEQVDRPTRDTLLQAAGASLRFSFRICHDHIYTTDGLQKQPAFFELLKVIFCKIWDERNIPHPLEFFATAAEKLTDDGRLTVANRLAGIFKSVKQSYPTIFDPNDTIKLQPRSLAYVVGELQRYSFLDSTIDVKGKAYEELVGSNLRGDRGEFFTPRNIAEMAVRMLDLDASKEERILDPSCGTGGFLVTAMNDMIDKLRAAMAGGAGKHRPLGDALKQALRDRIRERAASQFFGIDINPDLVKATKMNMVMNNDGAGNIYRQDTLLHPHQWESSFRDGFAKALGLKPSDLRQPKDLAHFDVVATNPPFGAKLPIKDQETLKQFDLGHIWKTDKTTGVPQKTDDVQSSQPPEILFIERCWQFLKPGGRMAIVLPDGVLGNPDLAYVRHWIMRHCRVVASIDLAPDTFQPRNGTQTSVLILQRKLQEEITDELINRRTRDYDIFMAQLHSCGHDKRGNDTPVRDADGAVVYFDDEEAAAKLETTAAGTTTVRAVPRSTRLDDDAPKAADEFLAWKQETVLGW